MKSKGNLDALLPLRALSFQLLHGYSNVRIYDFAGRSDWILYLDNYKDTTHYGEWINDAITDCLSREENLVSNIEEIESTSRQLQQWADSIYAAGKWIY